MLQSVAKYIVFLVIIFVLITRVSGGSGQFPDGLRNATTCAEFSQFARFNPHSVLNDNWFVFYYWGPTMPLAVYQFEYPPPPGKAYLHYLLDEHVTVPINWTARFVVMKEMKHHQSSLIVENGDRGQFLKYAFLKRTKKSPKIAPMDVRFKQINNGKYIAYMECQRETVFLMSRKEDIPSKKHIQDEAARAGFRSRGGKSYLYQGHQWMPIPEDDEESFWMTPEERKKEIDRLEMMRKYARPKKQ